jgi:hypothetical protein
MLPCYRGCHYSDCSYAFEDQRSVGYVGGAKGKVCRVARGKFSKLGARSGPRTRSAHSVPSRSDVLPSLLLQPAAITLCIDPGAVFISCLCIPCCLVPTAPRHSGIASHFIVHSHLSYLIFLSWFPSSLHFIVPNCLLLRCDPWCFFRRIVL